MEEKSRFSTENDPVFTELKNSELQCEACLHMMAGSVSECEKYYEKPGYVLYHTKPCPRFEPRNAKEAK